MQMPFDRSHIHKSWQQRVEAERNGMFHIFIKYVWDEDSFGEYVNDTDHELIYWLRHSIIPFFGPARLDDTTEIMRRRNHVASQLKHMVLELIRCGGSATYQNRCGQTILHSFLEMCFNHTESLSQRKLSKLQNLVRELLNRGASLLTRDRYGLSVLHVAAMCPNTDILTVMISCLSNVNACDCRGNSVLSIVISCSVDENKKPRSGFVDIVRNLVSEGAIVNFQNDEGRSPVHIAAGLAQLEILQYFARSCSADFRLKTHEDENALLFSCRSMLQNQLIDKSLVRDVLAFFANETNVDLDDFDGNGKTALYYAVEFGNVQAAEWLLLHGASVNPKMEETLMTPLHTAASTGHLRVMKWLIEKGADVNIEAADGTSPIYQAALFGSCEVLDLLIERGANLENRDLVAGHTLLHVSALGIEPGKDDIRSGHMQRQKGQQSGQNNKLNTIAKMGFNVNDPGYCGVSPLQMAGFMCNVDGVTTLIEFGAKVDFRSGQDFTALHMGALMANLPIVEDLIQAGADVNLPAGTEFLTPLHLSVMTDVTWTLGECPDARQNSSYMCDNSRRLRIRRKVLNDDVVKRLIENGAVVDIKDLFGRTPLHHAVRLRDNVLTKILLKFGAQVNIEDETGQTPLSIAIECVNVMTVKLLLKFGANVNDTDISAQIMSSDRLVKNAVIEHVIKLKLIGLPINQIFETSILDPSFTDFYTRCSEEADVLKLHHLNNFPLLRFIRMNERSQYHKVDEVSRAYDSLKEAFPLYFGIIQGICHEAVIRHRFLETAMNIWSSRVPAGSTLNEDCIDVVLSHMNNRYLEVFVRKPAEKIVLKSRHRAVLKGVIGPEVSN